MKGHHTPHSEEAKQKIRESARGNKYHLGHKHTEETRKKMSEIRKGRNSPMLGRKHTEKSRIKMSKSHSGKPKPWRAGEKCPSWKGNEAGKIAMHDWVKKWKGRPTQCEMCGTTTAKRFEWANVDHSYKRILEDYIRMCTSCHRKYDYKFNDFKKLK